MPPTKNQSTFTAPPLLVPKAGLVREPRITLLARRDQAGHELANLALPARIPGHSTPVGSASQTAREERRLTPGLAYV